MKLNVSVEEIMSREFPVVDMSQKLVDCANAVGGNSVCLVMNNGNFRGIISPKEVISGFLNGDEEIREKDLIKDMGSIDASEDVSYLLKLMEKNGLQFVLVRKEGNVIGVVTRQDLLKIPYLLNNLLMA